MLILINKLKFLIAKFPFIRETHYITKAYACSGEFGLDNSHRETFWWRRIFKKVIFIFVLSIALVFIATLYTVKIDITKLRELNFSLFSSLLGFAIGIYALIFSIPDRLFVFLDEKQKQGGKISPRMLNSDMAFPLIILALIILANLILIFFPENFYSMLANIFMLLYGMSMVFELIAVIFFSAHKSLGITATESKKTKRGNERGKFSTPLREYRIKMLNSIRKN